MSFSDFTHVQFSPEIEERLASIQPDGSPDNWVIWSVNTETSQAKFEFSGAEYDEFVEELVSDPRILFGYWKCHYEQCVKFILVCWAHISIQDRRQITFINQDCERWIKGKVPVHFTITAREEDDILEDDVRKKVARFAGVSYADPDSKRGRS